MGLGSRALDLTSLLFDWYRLALARSPQREHADGERLVHRIVQIAELEGLRCTLTCGAIARLALTARRAESGDVQIWTRTTDALLDSISRTV